VLLCEVLVGEQAANERYVVEGDAQEVLDLRSRQDDGEGALSANQSAIKFKKKAGDAQQDFMEQRSRQALTIFKPCCSVTSVLSRTALRGHHDGRAETVPSVPSVLGRWPMTRRGRRTGRR